MNAPVPVVVLTGFLGSGKTTLLNALLRRRAAREATSRLALIVNELGAVGIDGALLPPGASRQIELPGGCVCCVLSDALDATILELGAQTPPPTAILIETTGVAEPIGIAWTLESETLRDVVRLAAVVTVIDATYFTTARALGPVVEAQTRYADVLTLRKAELVSAEEATAVRAAASALAPQAPWIDGDAETVAAWLETLLEDPELGTAVAAGARFASVAPAGPVGGRLAAAPALAPASFAHGIQAIAVEATGTFDLERLRDQLLELPSTVVRLKGVLYAFDAGADDSSPRWVAVHRVGARVSSEPIAAPPLAQLVALGIEVDPAQVRACLDAARVP